MVKLSKTAWNNVIIFSTLILIVLFNFSSNLLNSNAEQHHTLTNLIPVERVITTIQYEQAKVERIGQGWRVKFAQAQQTDLSQLVNHWMQARIELFDTAFDVPTDISTVKIWFAGQQEPIEYTFLSLADKTLVKIDSRTYQLITPDFSLLILDQ